MGETPNNPRIETLDGLRGLACISVVALHITAAPALVKYAYWAMDAFFCLSGLVITLSLQASMSRMSTKQALAQFYWRRAWRIGPPYVATMIAVGLIFGWRDMLAPSIFVTNFAMMRELNLPVAGPLIHTWSLAVEEHFYLVWPLAFLTIPKISSYCRVIGVLCLLAAIGSHEWAWMVQDVESALYTLDPFRWPSLLSGCLIAINIDRLRENPAHCITAAVAIAVGLSWWHGPIIAASLPLGIASVLVAVWASFRGGLVERVLTWPPLVFAGTISYGLYLYHYPLTKAYLPTWIVAVTSVGLAVVSWYVMERPLIAWARVPKFGKQPHGFPTREAGPGA